MCESYAVNGVFFCSGVTNVSFVQYSKSGRFVFILWTMEFGYSLLYDDKSPPEDNL